MTVLMPQHGHERYLTAGSRVAMGLPLVPLELCERIIRFLTLDEDALMYDGVRIQTLKACALTCLAWRHIAQAELRHSISLTKKADVNRLFRAAASDGTLASSVKRIVVSTLLFDSGVQRFDKGTMALEHFPTFVLMLARKLPRLECLCIARGQWKAEYAHRPNHALYQGLSSFRTLTTLVLRNVWLPSSREFRSAILAIASLERLECQSVYWKRLGAVTSADVLSTHPRLRIFHLNCFIPMQLEDESKEAMYPVVKDMVSVLTDIVPEGQLTELVCRLRCQRRDVEVTDQPYPSGYWSIHTCFTMEDLEESGIATLLRKAGKTMRRLRLELTGWRHKYVGDSVIQLLMSEFIYV